MTKWAEQCSLEIPSQGVILSICGARNADGRLEIFARTGDYKIWGAYQLEPNGNRWSAWSDMGTQAQAIAVSANADGRLLLLANSGFDVLSSEQRTPNGFDGWTPWKSHGYATGDGWNRSPAILSRDESGKLYAFGRFADKQISYIKQRAKNNGWETYWVTEDDPAANWGANVTPTVVGWSPQGLMGIFNYVSPGELRYKWQSAIGEGFEDAWHTIYCNAGQMLGPPVAFMDKFHTLYLFALDMAGQLWVTHNSPDAIDAWDQWRVKQRGTASPTPEGGLFPSMDAPTVARDWKGDWLVFVCGDAAVWALGQNEGAWSKVTDGNGWMGCVLPNLDGGLSVFMRGNAVTCYRQNTAGEISFPSPLPPSIRPHPMAT